MTRMKTSVREQIEAATAVKMDTLTSFTHRDVDMETTSENDSMKEGESSC